MAMLLAFAPFLLFVVVERLAGPIAGLVAGAIAAAALLARDLLSQGRSVKVLEAGTLILFGGLALYTSVKHVAWTVIEVRLWVDAGLFLIVLVSIVIQRPFTLQYARLDAPKESWNNPAFIRTNYVITAVWLLAFLVLVLADLFMLYRPEMPLRFGIIATILALYGAYKFTAWYPEKVRRSNSL